MKSRKLQIKRVNFLRAHVAQHQRRVIRGQAAPGSNTADGQPGSFQTDNLLQLVVTDPNAKEGRVTSRGVKVNVVAIPRPIRKGGIRFLPVPPTFES